MTSPCSVTLKDPLTEPEAWASTARPAGPPPRPSAPPRPGNTVSRTSVAAAGACAERVLDPGHRAERRQHFLGPRGPAGTVRGAGPAAVIDAGRPGGPQFAQDPGVHLAVLPDLQARQVEPERLGHPDEV